MNVRQQINLYQPILRTRPTLFGASAAFRALIALVVTLALIWGYGAFKVSRLEQLAQSLREESAQQDKTLASASTINASRATPTDLAARVKQTDAEVVARTRALELLRAGAAGRTVGFAERLEALARRHVDGVWIDHMALSGGTGSMSLGGATLDPDLVPRYLQNLAQEPVLAGARFDQLIIERPKQKNSASTQIRFNASSAAAPVTASTSPQAEEGAT